MLQNLFAVGIRYGCNYKNEEKSTETDRLSR